MGVDPVLPWAVVLAALNWAACTVVGIVCVCRLNVMQGQRTRLIFRLKYILLLVGATACGFSTVLWGVYPGPGTLLMSLSLAAYLAAGQDVWHDHPPRYAQSGPAPLDVVLPEHRD